MADGTHTRVWVWMTDKCRKRINGREGYIITEITQSKGDGKRKEAQEKGRGFRDARGDGDSSPRANGPFSLGPLGCPILYVFLPSERAVASSEPNFRIYSLQIHCNGPSSKIATLQNQYLYFFFFFFFFPFFLELWGGVGFVFNGHTMQQLKPLSMH